jgi:hypothetical protein
MCGSLSLKSKNSSMINRVLTQFIFASIAFPGIQTPVKQFRATAKLGVPYTIGEVFTVHGTKEVIDVGELRILTVASTFLDLNYPNLSENISAGPGEKLFIVRGTLKNPSSVELPVGAGALFGMRFFDGKGKGEFKFIGTFDSQTHKYLRGSLKKGESANLDCVVKVPAKFEDFRVGFYFRSTGRMAWYDFNPSLKKVSSVFSINGISLEDNAKVSKEKAFDFDAFEMANLQYSESSAVGQHKGVVSVQVSNSMMLPAKWGWQYVTPELVLADGSVVPGDRDLIDQSTGKTWSGDLGGRASMTASFGFSSSPKSAPKFFRLTSVLTKRTVEVEL